MHAAVWNYSVQKLQKKIAKSDNDMNSDLSEAANVLTTLSSTQAQSVSVTSSLILLHLHLHAVGQRYHICLCYNKN